MTKVMNFKWKFSKNQKGLTLIELLAVVVILGILAAVGGVAVLGGFDKAKASSDATNVQIITDAVQRFIMAGEPKSDVTPTANAASSTYALGKLKEKGFLNSIPTVQGNITGGTTKGTYYDIAIDAQNVVTVTVK